MIQLSLPSDDPPRPARLAGLDGRFRYWRGASGRRYLFSVVPAEALADFRAAVAMFATPDPAGALIGRALLLAGADRPVRTRPQPGDIVLVHLLAGSDAARRAVVDDLAAVRFRLAA